MLCEEDQEKYTRCRVLCFKQTVVEFVFPSGCLVSYICIPLVPCINTKGCMFTAVIQRTHIVVLKPYLWHPLIILEV